MTVDIRKVTPGDGWQYFIGQIATGDEPRVRGRDLEEHQNAIGVPPGRWVGRAAALLGVDGQVTEPQMRALFGKGLHPRADEITLEQLNAGASAQQVQRATRLGARFPRFGATPTALERAIDGQIAAFEERSGRTATEDERSAARLSQGMQAFRAKYGRAPEDDAELSRFVARQLRPARRPVAAWHAVFRPAKSVSLLWALGGEETREVVEEAHDEAVSVTRLWIEEHALATRSGKGGFTLQVVPAGLVAAQFRHFESRCGQALLHDHVLIANRVQGADGRWRTIDGRLLLAQLVVASELYTQEVLRRVCVALDVVVEERTIGEGRRPVMEIAGVGADLIGANSVRSRDTRERLEQLLVDYCQRHGRTPDAGARIALMQQAALETRPPKKGARPLLALREAWRVQNVEAFGRARIDGLLDRARTAARDLRSQAGDGPLGLDVEAAARDVVEVVSRHRAVFGQRHVLAEATRYAVRTTRGRGGVGWAEQITDHALATACVDVTRSGPGPTSTALTGVHGSRLYRLRGAKIYTTRTLLAADNRLSIVAHTDLAHAFGERAGGPDWPAVEEVPRFSTPAERLAKRALAAAQSGQEAPELWVWQIAAPNVADAAQQFRYRRLIAALADWRLRVGAAGADPLGPEPEDHTADEWKRLSKALELYQRARIEERTALVRALREADRNRLNTTTSPHPPRRPDQPRTGPSDNRRSGRHYP
ncbi:MobF family relaxase [Kitasatospora cinereorecta]|uniref:MobF family relaxase n=1 Tax=Kitasatospora cinereorecta TaxID=285560 RepID=A0ABW0VHX0_9ACTN